MVFYDLFLAEKSSFNYELSLGKLNVKIDFNESIVVERSRQSYCIIVEA